MNESLKTIEAMLQMIYEEIKRNADNPVISDQTYDLLKEAYIDVISLQIKIESARHSNI